MLALSLKSMLTRLLIATMTCLMPCVNRAEETSILTGASVSTTNTSINASSYLIDGNFKTMAHSDGSSSNGGSKEFSITLSASMKILSVFVQNRVVRSLEQKRMGSSAIYVGNDSSYSYLSASLLKCSQYIYDTGFITLT